MTRYDSQDLEQDRYKMFLTILDDDHIPGINMYGVMKSMKKLKLDIEIMGDGTLVVKNLPKEHFDKVGRVIICNNKEYGLPVCNIFYPEEDKENG